MMTIYPETISLILCYNSAMESKKSWYKSNLGIIALLILFFPAGIFLMWKYTNWNKKAKWAITGIFVLLIAIGAFSNNNKGTLEQKNITTQASAQPEQIVNFYFDVPALIGKDLKEIQAVLGTPQGIDPTALQIQTGVKEWDKTFVKDGHELLVTYTIASNKVVDFFIGTDDASGQTKDKARLLKLGNLNENDPKYKVEFVKTIKDPSYLTGVKVIPN